MHEIETTEVQKPAAPAGQRETPCYVIGDNEIHEAMKAAWYEWHGDIDEEDQPEPSFVFEYGFDCAIAFAQKFFSKKLTMLNRLKSEVRKECDYQIPFCSGKTNCYTCTGFVSKDNFCQFFNATTDADKNCKYHQYKY